MFNGHFEHVYGYIKDRAKYVAEMQVGIAQNI
jgi:hypothetical protein